MTPGQLRLRQCHKTIIPLVKGGKRNRDACAAHTRSTHVHHDPFLSSKPIILLLSVVVVGSLRNGDLKARFKRRTLHVPNRIANERKQ